MLLDPLVIGGLATGAAAVSATAGLFLVPRIGEKLLPSPRETYLSDALQFDQVLEDGMTIKGKDGSLTQTLALRGIDYYTKTSGEVAGLITRRQSWLDLMARSGAAFKLITVRDNVSRSLPGSFDHDVLTRIHETWMKGFSDTYRNHHYIVFTQYPSRAKKITSFFSGKSGDDLNLKNLKELVGSTRESLHQFGCETLHNGDGNYSPLLSFWSSLLNCDTEPHGSFDDNLSERLISKSIHFDSSIGRISWIDGNKRTLGAVVSLKKWGEKSSPQIMKEILALPGRLIVLQLLKGHKKLLAPMTLRHQKGQACIPFPTKKTIDEFNTAIELIQGDEVSLYSHQASIFLIGESEEEIENLIDETKKIFASYGVKAAVETGAVEHLWKSLFPGTENFVRATHPLSHNISHLVTLDREPTGLSRCDWGEGALRLFKTPSGSSYSLQLHKSEENEAPGNALVVAPTGSGKTMLLQHLIGGALRHKNLRAYVFDRYNGTETFTQSIGGTYIDFSRSESVALNPFLCDDTPDNRSFLVDFLQSLSGCKDNESQESAARAINLLMNVPKEDRILNECFESIFEVGSDLRIGMQKWVGNTPHARWFNGARDGKAFDALDLSSSRLVGFEMTKIQKDPEVAAAVTNYVMNRIVSTVKDEAISHMIVSDESGPQLKDGLFRTKASSILCEHRKLSGSMTLCFQDPSAITDSGIQETILTQCSTWFLFPSPSASEEKYRMFELTDFEWEYIKGNNKISRHLQHSVLVKKENESVILDIDLRRLGPLLKLYRSGSKSVKLVRELQQQWGTSEWLEPYLASA